MEPDSPVAEAIANHLSQRSNELSALDITVWHGKELRSRSARGCSSGVFLFFRGCKAWCRSLTVCGLFVELQGFRSPSLDLEILRASLRILAGEVRYGMVRSTLTQTWSLVFKIWEVVVQSAQHWISFKTPTWQGCTLTRLDRDVTEDVPSKCVLLQIGDG